jgi:inner membrane transporter RhtA
MHTHATPVPARRVPPAVLVLLSISSTQVGAALASKLFGVAGPAGTVLLRVGFAAIILVATQGRLRAFRSLTRANALAALLFGLTLACMNFSFYSALDRVPLGVAVTVEFAGPLAVAVIGSRRALDFVWVALAAGGIVLFAPWTGARLDPLGVALALLAGVFWACYIFLSARVGRVFPGRSGLALAMCVAAVVMLPVGVVSAGDALLNPVVLLAGCGVALLSSALPYSLELEALRRLPTHVFGILMSLEPAVAALAGFLLLRQLLDSRELLGIALVTCASVGVTVAKSPRSPRPDADRALARIDAEVG